MIDLNNYILEKLHIHKGMKSYVYYPKTNAELKEIIKKRYKEEGDILDLNDIDVSDIKNFSYIFENIPVRAVDIDKWNMSNAEDIHGLFWDNKTIESIKCSSWDTHNVESMYGVFYECINLNKLDISNWDVSNVSEFNLMFSGCKSLPKDFDISGWKADKKKLKLDACNGMFNRSTITNIPKWVTF